MAKPLTVPPLSDSQVTDLRQLYDTTTDAKLRLRYQIVLLAHQGRSVAEIATIVFRSRDTVERVLKRFLSGGVAALPPHKAPGMAPPSHPHGKPHSYGLSTSIRIPLASLVPIGLLPC